MPAGNKPSSRQYRIEPDPPARPEIPSKAVDIHALYDEVAQMWARDEPKVHDDLIGRPIVVKLARELGANGTILDCGCGDGNVCRLVSPFAKRIIGVDLSVKMLAEAKKRSREFNNISYIRGRLEDLGEIIKPKSIDLCLALFAVCCVTNVDELGGVFRQIFKVLKQGGGLICQIPHPLDGLFKEPSRWFTDIDRFDSYFEQGQLVRRKLQTLDGNELLVARYHFPLSDYFNCLSESGFVVKRMIEPVPSPDAIRRYPTLSRESRLPSTMILLAQRYP